ncbi:MAG: lipopolysaccharide transport periplasmic protein LptA, partial [Pseudomonadales bacterium]
RNAAKTAAMSNRLVVLTFAVLAFALAADWLLERTEAPLLTAPRNEPDIYMVDAYIDQYADTGELQRQIHAKRFTHYPATDHVALVKPTFLFKRAGGEDGWEISSAEGRILPATDATEEIIQLQDQVVAESYGEQPVHINADAARLDEGTGTSVYQGNVVIVQGSLQVTADEVEVQSADEEVTQIVARAGGDGLAHYEQQTSESGDMVYADARQITYLVREEQLHLAGQARLQQAEDVFSGELLRYDISQKTVKMAGDAPGERISITRKQK